MMMNGECLELKLISCGVPQGVCSWSFVILNLPNISNKLDLYLFADDTNIL